MFYRECNFCTRQNLLHNLLRIGVVLAQTDNPAWICGWDQSLKIPANRIGFPGHLSPFPLMHAFIALWCHPGLGSFCLGQNQHLQPIWMICPPKYGAASQCSPAAAAAALKSRSPADASLCFVWLCRTYIQRCPLVRFRNIWCIFWMLKWEDPIMTGVRLCGKWITYGILRPGVVFVRNSLSD